MSTLPLVATQEEAHRAPHSSDRFLPPTYEEYDLDACAPDHLTPKQRIKFRALLEKYRDRFKGRVGRTPGPPLELELKEGAEPYYRKPFTIPLKQLAAFKREVDRLEREGILERVTVQTLSMWGSPCFGSMR